MNIEVKNGLLSEQEINAYVEYVSQKFPDKAIKSLEINVDGEFVDLKYEFEPVPFERIRRITGYLVGTTDRWNSAKLAELNDRVKHMEGNHVE